MGSRSDWETMRHAAETLEALEVPFEQRVVSAHRTPDLLFEYAGSAEERGLQVLIAGAGGAAHLPGMAAAKTALPVLGVPVESKTLKGMDSLLSIVQMPAGMPVGTLAIGRAGAVNAALLAAAIVARSRRGHPRAARALPRGADRVVLASPDPAACVIARRCIGGGQLGRMLALAGIPLGLSFRFLDPSPDAPAAEVGELLVGAYDDPELLDRLADGAAASRTSSRTSRSRRRERVGAMPGAAALEAAQDRLVEKQLFRRLGIPTPQLDDEVDGVPGDPEDAPARLRRQGAAPGRDMAAGQTPDDVLEELVPFDRELSLIAVRGRRRRDALLPAGRERPSRRDPAASRAPAADAPQAEAEAYARALLDALGYVGVLALELFDVGGQPARERVRAAGPQHRPLDDRGRRDEPVREPPARDPRPAARLDRALAPSVMVNLIGATPPAAACSRVPGAHLHLYGKEPRPGRKLGHVTLVEPTRTSESELLSAALVLAADVRR